MKKGELIRKLAREGKTTKQIAKMVGLSTHGVRYHREKSKHSTIPNRIAKNRILIKRKAVRL